MMHVGDIMSTMGGYHEYRGGYHDACGGYDEYRGVMSGKIRDAFFQQAIS